MSFMMRKLLKKLESIIFPNTCLSCHQIISEDGFFCQKHWSELKFISQPKCKICSQPFEYVVFDQELICPNCLKKKPAFDSLFTVFYYNDAIKKIIFDLKYHDQVFLAKNLAKLLFNQNKKIASDVDFITFVPIHKKRLSSRKYNQSALLAKFFWQLCQKENPKIRFIPDLLIKVKNTKSQTNLTKIQRQKNLNGAFIFNEKYNLLEGKNILIIDDVVTTGTTLEKCCNILKNKGKTQKIFALTLAKNI